MDQANDLTRRPDLCIVHVSAFILNIPSKRVQRHETRFTYTVLRITIDKHLPAPRTIHIRRNLRKLASGTLLLHLQRLVRDLVFVQTRRVSPAAQNKRCVRLLRLNDLLLDVVVDGRLDRAHKARAHVDTAGAEAQSGGEALAVSESARGDVGRFEGLAGAGEENEVGDVGFADVAGGC